LAGLSSGIRLTVPTAVLVVDVEARADLVIGSWLMMATIRSAVASCLGQQGIDCDVYTDVSVGIGVGRRFRAGVAVVDLTLAPSFVVMNMEYDIPPGSERQEVEGTVSALRFDLSSRLAVPLATGWALTLTVDGGVAPTLVVHSDRLDLPLSAPAGTPLVPPFPAWTGGVRLGVIGALL
jgi:hypothetical protein